jgi:molecular chaperone GrpE
MDDDDERTEVILDLAETRKQETGRPQTFEIERPTEVFMIEMAVPSPLAHDETEAAPATGTTATFAIETEVASAVTVEPGPEPEPGPAPERGRGDVEALAVAMRDLDERVTRRLDGLALAFEREVRAESTREKIVDRLHDELQQYKGDLLLGTLKPVLLDLVQLHDDIGKVAVSPSGQAEEGGGPAPEVARLLGLMRGFQQGIEDILYRQGVEPFEVEGPMFDPRRQRAVATVATDDPSLARTVAGRLRKGFAAGEKVIRPELVTVRKYAATGPSSTSS